MKKLLLIAAAGLSFLASGVAPAQAEKLNVVASTAFFEDLVKQIGGERVNVKRVAPPRFNIHFIQPKPSDVRNVAKADLFVFGGLDLEAWVDPLLEASGNRKAFRGGDRNVDLSAGIPLLKVPAKLNRAAGDVHAFGNPHYTLNPQNLGIMAATLAGRLKDADPSGADVYEANLARFRSELDVKLAEWRSAASVLRGKEIVAYHDDVAYLAEFAGLRADVFVEPKPGIPPTPQHVKFLQEYLPAHGVSGIVAATYYPKATVEELSRRTGVPALFVPQTPGEIPGTESVFAFFDHVFKTLKEGLK